MNKAQLINAVAERTGSTKKDAEASVNAMLDTIQTTVAKGEDITITGFGSWKRAERSPRKGVNHLSGKPWSVPATFVPKWKAGKDFKDAVAPAA
ncbi:MAG TPA: HU family DNA-binding protein [Actinoallomurus sp.]|nr:HU family DNA-binding protein [Actinoallomurus sp.]